MKRLGLSLLLIAIIVGITGCGKNSPSATKIEATKMFQFTNAKLNLTQFVETKIVYHTKEELETIFNEKFTKALNNNNLLSNDKQMNTLVINVNYERRFVGDKTPMSSDSLAYPNYSYTIEVLNNNKSLGTIKKDNLTFKGGFSMNLQIIAASLKDKKYEIDFIEALSNAVFNDIENLN